MIHEEHRQVIHEVHKPVIHEQHKQIVTEEHRGPQVQEIREKPVVKTEVRPPVVERNVTAPVVRQEGVIEPTKVVTGQEAMRVQQAAVPKEEESAGLTGMIKGVFSDIKHTLVGDDKK